MAVAPEQGGAWVPGDPGPMVRRRQLALALRTFRGRAGLSVADAATAILSASSKISRIESAQRGATLRDVRDLAAAYRIPDDIRDQLMHLARESRQRAWWSEWGLDPALENLIGMEGAAKRIREFEPLLIPGLLQTPAYASAVSEAYRGTDERAKKVVYESRMRRQHILDGESPPGLRVVLDEAALRRAVGGPAVMREQILHLIALVEEQKATIEVIRFSAGIHVGTLNGFIILEFDQPIPGVPELEMPGIVYVETLGGGTYIDQPAEVKKHLSWFADLSKLALSPSASRDFLRTLVT